MRLAISGELLGSDKTLPEILGILKEYDVNAIELWPENIPLEEGKELVHKRLYANRDVKKAKEILKKEGVKVACICFGAGFDEKLAADTKLFSSELTRAVEVAHELGARVVNHYCAHVARGDEWSEGLLHQYYDEALRMAEKYQIYLALENEAHDITKNPAQMKKILQAMNAKYFCTNYDAVNYYQSGYEGFPYAYDLLKEFIVHVHIKNGCIYRPQFGHKETCRGEEMTGKLRGECIYYPTVSDGAVNVGGIIRRLQKDGYDGFCILEPHVALERYREYYKVETDYMRQMDVET